MCNVTIIFDVLDRMNKTIGIRIQYCQHRRVPQLLKREKKNTYILYTNDFFQMDPFLIHVNHATL